MCSVNIRVSHSIAQVLDAAKALRRYRRCQRTDVMWVSRGADSRWRDMKCVHLDEDASKDRDRIQSRKSILRLAQEHGTMV
jgi:hypothetical protein